MYSDWVAAWVRKLDPKAPDELLILAKGVWKSGSVGAMRRCVWLRKGPRRAAHTSEPLYLPLSSFFPRLLGRSVESWKLSDIKRDDYSPNPQVHTYWGARW